MDAYRAAEVGSFAAVGIVIMGLMLAPFIAELLHHSAPTHTSDNPNCFPRDTPGVEDFPLCPDNTRNEMETT